MEIECHTWFADEETSHGEQSWLLLRHSWSVAELILKTKLPGLSCACWNFLSSMKSFWNSQSAQLTSYSFIY